MKTQLLHNQLVEWRHDLHMHPQLSFEEKRKFSDTILDNSDDQNKWINTIKQLL